jgi:hypothetical protein
VTGVVGCGATSQVSDVVGGQRQCPRYTGEEVLFNQCEAGAESRSGAAAGGYPSAKGWLGPVSWSNATPARVGLRRKGVVLQDTK